MRVYNDGVARKLGQYFLQSERIIRAVADVLPVPPDSAVVEIGPGRGALTECLLKKGGHVIAVEKDADLADMVRARFADADAEGRLHVIDGDARDIPWADAVTDAVPSGRYVIIANIPYYITGSLIRLILSCDNPPAAMALIVQKEVAERITARNGKESLLSLSVRLFGTPAYHMKISRSAFRPVPRVDSALISITDIRPPSPELRDIFFSVVRPAFAEKRKTVLKKFADRPVVRESLIAHKVTDTTRAEDVPFSVWSAVSRVVRKAESGL